MKKVTLKNHFRKLTYFRENNEMARYYFKVLKEINQNVQIVL